MIKLQDISFKYEELVLDNINLEFDKGKITFILGVNGAGKSTLGSIIAGLLQPNKGKVFLDEIEINKKTKNEVMRKKIGMILQNPNNQIIFPKVYDDIKFILENLHFPKDKIKEIIEDSLKKVGMIDYIMANSYNLSGGQKQRIAIASMLALKPDYLIFDEATSMLDTKGKKQIFDVITELKKEIGIIFITNNLEELIYADYVVIISNHKVYKYSTLDIIENIDILTKYGLDIPFVLKIANKLKINNVDNLSEDYILERIGIN